MINSKNTTTAMPFSPTFSLPKEKAKSTHYRLGYLSLLLFLFLLSSALPSYLPVLNTVRLALVVAFFAIIAGIIGKLNRRETLILRTPSYLILMLMAVVVLGVPGALWPYLAFSTAIDALKILMIFLLISNVVNNVQMLLGVSWALCLGGILPALGTIKNCLTGEGLVDGNRGAWVGVYANPNDLAYIMAMLVTLAIGAISATKSKLAKLVGMGCIGLYIITIFFTYSRMGFLCLVGIAFMTLLRSQNRVRNFLLIFVMAIMSLPFVPSAYWDRVETITSYQEDRSSVGRLEAWEAGIKMVEERPVLGVGAGCYILGWTPDYDRPHTQVLTAHNTFFQALGELGVTGFTFFCLFLVLSLKQIWKLKRSLLQKQTILTPDISNQQRQLLFLVTALEVGLGVFVISSLTGGLLFTWYPYIFSAMGIAAQEIYQKQLSVENTTK